MQTTESAGAAPAAAKPRLDSLTSLRFFAAFFVMAFHARNRWLMGAMGAFPRWVDNILSTGYVSVGFFFVLSGFVLAYTYGTGAADLDRRRFWAARVARIYPVFLLGLLIGAVPALMAFHHAQPWGAALKTFAWTGALNVTLLNAFSNMAGVWNAPAWSLSTEAFFYLSFPWVMAGIWKLDRRGLWISVLWFCALSLLIPLLWCASEPLIDGWKANVSSPADNSLEMWVTLIGYSPIGRIFDFALGISLGKLFLTRESQTRGSLLAVLLTFAVCFAVLAQSPEIPHLVLNNGLLNLGFAVLIYQFACGVPGISQLLQRGWLIGLGEASYALYILHVPVRDWLMAGNRFLRGPGWLLFSGYTVFMLALSVAVFKLLEKPMRERILARLAPRKR